MDLTGLRLIIQSQVQHKLTFHQIFCHWLRLADWNWMLQSPSLIAFCLTKWYIQIHFVLQYDVNPYSKMVALCFTKWYLQTHYVLWYGVVLSSKRMSFSLTKRYILTIDILQELFSLTKWYIFTRYILRCMNSFRNPTWHWSVLQNGISSCIALCDKKDIWYNFKV